MCNYKKAIGSVTLIVVAVACSDAPTSPSARITPIATVSADRGTGTTLTPFYNVGIQAEAFAINAYFQYAGKGTPWFHVGGTPDFANPGSIAAKNMNNGFWLARIEKLTPGRQWYLKLDDGKSTWLGSAKTYQRQVIIDIDKVYVSFDGDAGINCGEMIFKAWMYPMWNDEDYQKLWYSHWHDVCSGETIVLSDAEGRTVLTQWEAPKVGLDLSVFESDSCWAVDSTCGDLDYAAQKLSWDVSGGVKSYVFKITTSATSYVKLMWEGTVKTTFEPW